MSKAWIRAKLPEFVRDMFRYFCQCCYVLEPLFQAYAKTGVMDFEQLKELIGQENSKGTFWRLKDTAHHVFRNDPHDSLEGRFLDWALGYIFHECIKLKENAYQQLTYAPWLKDLDGNIAQAKRDIAGPLAHVPMQTEESMRREIDRIKSIIAQCKHILPDYLTAYADNKLLARFIVTQNALVQSVFQDQYQNLLHGIYGDKGKTMYLLAAQNLRNGGWLEEARQAEQHAYLAHQKSKIFLQTEKFIAT